MKDLNKRHLNEFEIAKDIAKVLGLPKNQKDILFEKVQARFIDNISMEISDVAWSDYHIDIAIKNFNKLRKRLEDEGYGEKDSILIARVLYRKPKK